MAINNQLQTIIVWAENKKGVLNRIFTLIRRRNYNVETITAGHTHIANISRITLTFSGSLAQTEQLVKQLYKIVEIIKIYEATPRKSINRELALIKIRAHLTKRLEIMEIVKHFRAKIVNFNKDSVIIEITGKEDKINSMIDILRPYGVLELARTGCVAMQK